jgi:hypothetical protein
MPVVRPIVSLIIPAGQVLSAGVDCSEGYLARIQMPSTWNSANLSFQISHDGVQYYDLLDNNGKEALMAVIPGTARMVREEPWSSGIGWWKLRSGSRANPIVQDTDRTFMITLAPPGT